MILLVLCLDLLLKLVWAICTSSHTIDEDTKKVTIISFLLNKTMDGKLRTLQHTINAQYCPTIDDTSALCGKHAVYDECFTLEDIRDNRNTLFHHKYNTTLIPLTEFKFDKILYMYFGSSNAYIHLIQNSFLLACLIN